LEVKRTSGEAAACIGSTRLTDAVEKVARGYRRIMIPSG
jgi:hypothetical protein